MLMGLPDHWDACSRTIFLEGRPVAFAHRGDIVAVGMESNVVFLDVITGISTSVLSGHTDVILSLAFSLDGTMLVSRSNDKTVKLWDVQTGGVIKTFGDHTSAISSVSISPDCATVASGTWAGAIRLWDVRTGKCHLLKTRHDGAITAITFSPTDPRRLITSSMGTTLRQWDIDGHQIGVSHREGAIISHIAYTSDGTRYVSCAGDVVTVRDSESGVAVVKLDTPNRSFIRQCCFSSNGRLMACAADRNIYVWDVAEPKALLVGNLVGHSSPISFIAFSSSLISAAIDQSLKFWQSSSFLADSATSVHVAPLHDPTRIRSVKLFAEDYTVVTSDVTGTVKTWDLMTGRCKESFSTPAKGIQDTHLEGDTLIVVWWVDEEKRYHIWDAGGGQLVRTVDSSLNSVSDIKVAGDGSKIFGLGGGFVEARFTQTGEDVGKVRLTRGLGSRIILHGSIVEYEHKKGWGWDFGGPEVSNLIKLPDGPHLGLVDWSDGRKIKPRWIEDTITRRQVFRLPDRYIKSDTEIAWDGRYLLVWSRSGDVVIMDFDSVCPR